MSGSFNPITLPMNWEKIPDAVFMQFTGCTDKNGVEIYEGDIVNYLDPVALESGSDKWKQTGIIAWNEKRFYYYCTYTNDLLCKLELPEVIGNIYETPELIK